MLGITFGTKHSFNDWGVILEDTKVAPPQPKRYTVSVAGRNGVLDLTQELTPSIRFESRTLTFSFRVKAGDWSSLMSQIYGDVHGRTMDVISDLDPDWHWHGFVTVDDFSSDERTGSLVITVDADPFKYSNQMTTYTVEGNGTIVAVNDRMEVVPTIIVDRETQIVFGDLTTTVVPSRTVLKTVSGEIVSFDDANGSGVVSLTADINPVQSGSGDPSPTNVRPISGWDSVDVNVAGKNLIAGDKYQAVDNTTTVYFSTDTNQYNTYLRAGTYTFSIIYSAARNNYPNLYYKISDGNNTSLGEISSSKTFTLTKDGSYTFWLYANPNTKDQIYSDDVASFWLEAGSTATDYEPYNGNTTTVALGQTVYGGSLNVTSGELDITNVGVDMGNLTWTASSSANNVFYASISTKLAGNYNILCSNYKVTSATNIASMGDKEIKGHATNTVVYVKDTSYSDATTFKTAMSGVQLVFERATPTTVQLTPTQVNTLIGQNNVWADSGDVEVTYNAFTTSPVLIDNIELVQGNNTLQITSDGTTTIQYTKGRL